MSPQPRFSSMIKMRTQSRAIFDHFQTSSVSLRHLSAPVDLFEKLTKPASLLCSLPSSELPHYCQSNRILIHSLSITFVVLDTNLFHNKKCRRRSDDLCYGIGQHFDRLSTMNDRVLFETELKKLHLKKKKKSRQVINQVF